MTANQATAQTVTAKTVTARTGTACSGTARSAPWPDPAGRVRALDGLRLVAALAVVVYHYTYRAPDAWGRPATEVFPAASTVTGYGWLGVELFFLISGFVICMSAWERPLGEFFAARAARLYPAYWAAVLVTTAVVMLAGPAASRQSPTDVAVNLTMLQTPLGVPSVDGVYWTLWAELRFYLLFAIVVRLGVDHRRCVLFCLLWTVTSAVATRADDPLVGLLVGPNESPFFIAGIALYLVYRGRPTALLCGIVGVSWLLGLHRLRPTASAVAAAGGGRTSWVGVVVVVTAIFAVMLAVALRRLPDPGWSWLPAAGALTYPLYLLHQQIGWTAIGHLRGLVPPWPLVAGVTAAMLAASWLVHRLVERPVRVRLRRALDHAVADLRTASASEHSRAGRT